MNLFVITGIAKAPLSDVIRGALPYATLMLLGWAIVFAFSALATWLPRVAGSGGWFNRSLFPVLIEKFGCKFVWAVTKLIFKAPQRISGEALRSYRAESFPAMIRIGFARNLVFSQIGTLNGFKLPFKKTDVLSHSYDVKSDLPKPALEVGCEWGGETWTIAEHNEELLKKWWRRRRFTRELCHNSNKNAGKRLPLSAFDISSFARLEPYRCSSW